MYLLSNIFIKQDYKTLNCNKSFSITFFIRRNASLVSHNVISNCVNNLLINPPTNVYINSHHHQITTMSNNENNRHEI